MWCVRCIISSSLDVCPECFSRVDIDTYRDLGEQLDLITQASTFKPPPSPPATSISTIHAFYRSNDPITCTVSLIGGDMAQIPASTLMSVQRFKEAVHGHFQIASKYQRLMFGGQELKPYKDGHEATLQDYNIVDGSSLQLMRLMLSVNEETPYNSINFVLRWAAMYGRRAFLDASCFVYRGNQLAEIVDFKHPLSVAGIRHSGPAHNTTQHTLRVSLPHIRNDYTHLFFVMSACHLGSLSQFRSPTVALYDTSRPTVQISDYHIEQAHSQSVIMCCMKRTDTGGWDAFTLGRQSDGYCYNYAPIATAIAALFNSRTV